MLEYFELILALKRRSPRSPYRAFNSLKRAYYNLLPSRVLTIVMVAVIENISTILGRGHETLGKFIDAPERSSVAILRERRVRIVAAA